MNTKDFIEFWKLNYKNTIPLGYELKNNFKNRWFRIHNLPKSKRYADTKNEHQIILDRQNQLITDIIGNKAGTVLLFTLITNDTMNANYYKYFDFTEFEKANSLDLHKIREEDYDPGIFLDIYIKTTKWKVNTFDEILKAIADDEIRVLLISPSKNRVIVPYDGGVDVVMENEYQRNEYKLKYKDWLSDRTDGL